jgi:hypothetical protein
MKTKMERSTRSEFVDNWKGFLRLSLVTCPIAAPSDSEKVSFNQMNKNTGHRIKYAKVDAETGEEVSNDDIIKGYKIDTDTFVTVDKDEVENIASDKRDLSATLRPRRTVNITNGISSLHGLGCTHCVDALSARALAAISNLSYWYAE